MSRKILQIHKLGLQNLSKRNATRVFPHEPLSHCSEKECAEIVEQHTNFKVRRLTKEKTEKMLVQSGLIARNAAFRTQKGGPYADEHGPYANLQTASHILCRGLMSQSCFMAEYAQSSEFFLLLEEVGAPTKPNHADSDVVGGYVTETTADRRKKTETSEPKKTRANFDNLIILKNSEDGTNGLKWSEYRIHGICGVTGTIGLDGMDYDSDYPLIIPLFCCMQAGEATDAVRSWTWPSTKLQLAGKRLMFSVLKWAKRRYFQWIMLTPLKTALYSCFYQDIGFRFLTSTDRADINVREYSPEDLGIKEKLVVQSLHNLNDKQQFTINKFVLCLKNWNKKDFPIKWVGRKDPSPRDASPRDASGRCIAGSSYDEDNKIDKILAERLKQPKDTEKIWDPATLKDAEPEYLEGLAHKAWQGGRLKISVLKDPTLKDAEPEYLEGLAHKAWQGYAKK